MAFKFSLEALLRVRERMFELAKMEFAKLINRKKEIEKELELARSSLKEEADKLKREMEVGIMSSDFNLRIQLIASMEQKIRELDGRLKEVEVDLLKAKEDLKQKHIDYELVKKLKDSQLKKYLKEVNAKLQKELDELVSIKHARLRGGIK